MNFHVIREVSTNPFLLPMKSFSEKYSFSHTEVYWGPCQTSKMECFIKKNYIVLENCSFCLNYSFFLFTGLGESTSWAWEMFGRRCLIFKLKFNWTIQENHHQPLKITRKKRSTIFSLMSFPALIYIQIFRCSDYYRTASVAGHLHQKKKTGSWVESYEKWWTVSRWKFVSSKLKITSFHVVLCKLF